MTEVVKMRILCNAAGGFGHLYPLVSLARALAESGHDVALAVPEYFAATARETGIETIALCADGVAEPSAEYKALQDARLPVERGRIALGRYLDQGVRQVPALLDAIASWQPQLLVRETTAFAAWLAGEVADLPVAVFDFAPTPGKLLAATAGDLFGDARAAVGLAPDPKLASLNRWLHLLSAPVGWFSPRVMGPTTHLFQPIPEPAAAQAAPEWLRGADDGWPFVYVTLGTFYNTTPGLFEMIFDVLRDAPVAALATVGRDVDPASFGRMPGHVRIERFVPQAAVLAHTDAVICHSGYGTLMGPLRRGIPVVTMPLGAADDTPNAARVAALGAGVALSAGERSAGSLREALNAVLTQPRYRQAAARVAASMKGQPPMRAMVGFVERLGIERMPVLGPVPA
ncbi:glycosyltransferase [Micromonospora sp. CA-263727]|uniref:glycosyltransferase n=1 Tax=Micromonospora sp. CA-263727 TaxID=3239967 RepID=UPI003D8A258B